MEREEGFYILELTKAQYEKLEDVLYEHCDEGPTGEGWASEELTELRGLVTAIEPPEDK